MRKISIFIACVLLGSALRAQEADTSASRVHVEVGLQAGAQLLLVDDDQSPYHSALGLTVQVPVMLHYDLAPHWRLSTGLRYEWWWNPMRYAVDVTTDGGLAFDATPRTGRSQAWAYRSTLSLPLQATWYPFSHNHDTLSLTAECFVAYNVGSNINIYHHSPTSGSTGGDHNYGLLPWRLEVGLTLATDYIGLLHGVRLSANLLPTYKDPTTGDKVYTAGLTLFL